MVLNQPLFAVLFYVVIFLMLFYGEYVRVMGIYRAHLKGILRWYHYAILSPWLVAGAVMDVVCNITIGTVVFREFPRQLLLTTRMTQILADEAETEDRKNLAYAICHGLLDPFDPSGNHCDDAKTKPLST